LNVVPVEEYQGTDQPKRRPPILRNIYIGIARFDQLQESLGVSRKVLAERLRWLTETGVLERREYVSRPSPP